MIVVYNLHFGPRPFVGLLRCELMLMSIADLNYIYMPGMSQKWQEKSPVYSFLVNRVNPHPEPPIITRCSEYLSCKKTMIHHSYSLCKSNLSIVSK